MEYTILILLLPLLSFLTLGIGGKWMTHRTAGIIGTTVLAVVALLSYATAWQYFSAPRLADGTFATLMPYTNLFSYRRAGEDVAGHRREVRPSPQDRKSTRLNSSH